MERDLGSRTPIEIDARPRGAAGPLAAHPLDGRAVLVHLLDALERVGPARIVLHARASDASLIAALVPERDRRRVSIAIESAKPETAMLRSDRLYDAGRLARALRSGGSPERAVIWRLDTPVGLAGAEDELRRRSSYQPLGRYWALTPARWLAVRLAPTPIRPNAVTIAAFAFMVGAAAMVAAGGAGWAVALALAIGLVLDTSDGHLARLQGTASDFGRWLDSVLDELADVGLHIAISWAAYRSTGQVWWLLMGGVYVGGKHVFQMASADWDLIRSAKVGEATTRESEVRSESRWKEVSRGLAHADLRWHLWIGLALVSRLDLALLAYAAYYPARMMMGIPSKRRAGTDASV